MTAPVFFISHGAPTFALEGGRLGPLLRREGAALRDLSDLRAILVVSPHWHTHGLRVMTTARPATVHDFAGFPAALYDLRYPVDGAPALARQATELLRAAGWVVSEDEQRGLDHGAWVPLMHLLPQGDLPVFQVSLPRDLTPAQAIQLGHDLAPLRAQGVVVVGSGSMTHNLFDFGQFSADQPAAYAQAFTAWVHEQLMAVQPADQARPQLVDYRTRAPHAVQAHPTDEHFLPLLVALGASEVGESVRHLDGGLEFGMLAMDSYVWG